MTMNLTNTLIHFYYLNYMFWHWTEAEVATSAYRLCLLVTLDRRHRASVIKWILHVWHANKRLYWEYCPVFRQFMISDWLALLLDFTISCFHEHVYIYFVYIKWQRATSYLSSFLMNGCNILFLLIIYSRQVKGLHTWATVTKTKITDFGCCRWSGDHIRCF